MSEAILIKIDYFSMKILKLFYVSIERSMNYNPELLLNPIKVKSLVEFWLEEDIPGFDVGAAVVGNKISTGSKIF